MISRFRPRDCSRQFLRYSVCASILLAAALLGSCSEDGAEDDELAQDALGAASDGLAGALVTAETTEYVAEGGWQRGVGTCPEVTREGALERTVTVEYYSCVPHSGLHPFPMDGFYTIYAHVTNKTLEIDFGENELEVGDKYVSGEIDADWDASTENLELEVDGDITVGTDNFETSSLSVALTRADVTFDGVMVYTDEGETEYYITFDDVVLGREESWDDCPIPHGGVMEVYVRDPRSDTVVIEFHENSPSTGDVTVRIGETTQEEYFCDYASDLFL